MSASSTSPAEGGARGRLLVVDDNTANLQLLTGLLRERGYLAFPASDGELALEFARSTPPDLILLDLKMPGLDGEEVCRRLKAADPTRAIPVIFISALESEGDRVRCFRVGGVDYISKPFRPEEVLARVETHLALRRVQLDLERRNAELAAARSELEDRVRARTAELAESRLFLDTILDAVADPVFVLDAERRRVLVNEAMCRLTGRPREALSGGSEPPLFRNAEGAAFDARNAAVLASGREDADEETLPDAAGGRRAFLIRRTLFRDGRGAPFLVGVMRDVTDYKRMQEQVLQSQKMETIGLLAGGVAHDFNNLLAPILSCSELMLGEMDAAHPWREMTQDVLDAARSGQSLTQRLLAFSRKQRFEPRPVDVAELVRRFEGMIRRTLREDIAVRIELAPDLHPVRADAAQLQQVLANLSVNAQDAMPRGGTLTIAAKEVELDQTYQMRHREVAPGRYVMISVTDTGSGMDEATLSHLFEPFFTTKEQGRGTGLGLSTVFGIVKQHGGSITVYSEPGRGTTLQVFLPVAEGAVEAAAAVPARPAEPAAGAARAAETILVTEDDDRVRHSIVRILKRQGYRVLEAGDADHCLEVASAHEGAIPLLVTDVIMPGKHGTELYDALKVVRPGLKVLFMSGYPSLVVGGREELSPEVQFIQKPFSSQELADKVRAVLDGA